MFFFVSKPYYVILLINLLLLFPCKIVAQTSDASPPAPDNNVDYPASGRYHFSPAMSVIFVIVVVVFFMIGCFSVFQRRCIEAGSQRSNLLVVTANHVNRRSSGEGTGLEPSVVDTFPTFLYSDVKKLKFGGTAELECAICLNEFKDDHALRLLPKCCHVFHPECIDKWLTSHVTCPVCRADLVPVPGETRAINCDLSSLPNNSGEEEEESDRVLDPGTDQLVEGKLGRSHSTDDSLIRASYERFTLRLPEDVQKKLTKPELRRAKSNLVFPGASSSKRGYRSSSVGPSLEIHNSQQESDREDRWGFTMAPPFLIRSHSVEAQVRGDNNGNVAMASGSSSKPNKSAFERLFSGSSTSRSKDDPGERSSAKLMGNNIV